MICYVDYMYYYLLHMHVLYNVFSHISGECRATTIHFPSGQSFSLCQRYEIFCYNIRSCQLPISHDKPQFINIL